MKINEFDVGDLCIFKGYHHKNDYAMNLSSIGLLPGTLCKVLAYSPFKDMLQIEFRGNCVALRQKEVDGLVFEDYQL
ncbi:MAG: hypothetical protein CMF42_05400 [Legionellales bacterium]|nr:hypothetical protein [Legionellales bacterium]OUX66848.1 MAG: hypothetical protein CBD38_03745 [bacterium TMED178]|tara:strand:+ start:1493 stop:1723 length:231 start_codon:yes stop_codon:yes gene_type:complete